MSFRVLTVGDGDLSFSLALKRAYPEICVTASTLVESPAELCRTYASAVETSKEFQDTFGERIIYGMDATKLEEEVTEKFDVVLFNHPHLGDGSLFESERRHAERHHALLSHYFASATRVLKEDGRVHVQLCGNQPESWGVVRAARGLDCVARESTARRMSEWLFREGGARESAAVKPHYPAERRFRNGALGSKHFLAKYGYRHRRTEGDLFDGSVRDIRVEQSINFVFARKAATETTSGTDCVGEHECHICRLRFESDEQLKAHLDAPGLPDIVTGAYEYSNKSVGNKDASRSMPRDGEKQPITDLPFVPINIEEATILVESTVDPRFDSKRLKWLCRQEGFALSAFIKSKSQCEDAIRKGRVFVNQQIAVDSGRIVRENDVVSLAEEYTPTDGADTTKGRHGDLGVRDVQEVPSKRGYYLQVVYKPVGVRCVGSFSPNTLEMITKRRAGHSRGTTSLCCRSASKLDTGVQGLCVLLVSPQTICDETVQSLDVAYTFTALVHGRPPGEWIEGVYVKVPEEVVRQWKRRTPDVERGEGDSGAIETSSAALDLDGALHVKCHDSLRTGERHVATLTVRSRFDRGRLGNVISFVLRKLGHPVVNDRFCKREYATLPRKMKNIVKRKICLGCYCVDVRDKDGTRTRVTIESHKRTQCSFWREVLP